MKVPRPAEQGGDREPVGKATDHGGLGAGPDQADPESCLAGPGNCDVDKAHRDQQRGRKGAVTPERLALIQYVRRL